MIDAQRLMRKCSALGLPLNAEQAEMLDRYAELLIETNRQINLTAITEPEQIEDKHFIDSLHLAVQPEISGRVVDVGSGAGFPGIVAKIVKPEIALTLMEPTGKRLDFLRRVVAELGLTGVEFAKERAEEAARKGWREQFDAATARAVAALPALLEYCLPLVKVGGSFVAMKGQSAAAEADAARFAAQKLGAAPPELRPALLPGKEQRWLAVYPKRAATPPVYPRAGSKIAKAPLLK